MKQTGTIFRERLRVAWTEGLRYFILIAGNGGMPILLILAAIIFSYAYTTFLSWVPVAFPSYLLMALIIAIVLTKCTVRTFIQKPDIVFLLPLEPHMSDYFRQSLVYSAIMQVTVVGVSMGLFYPLYIIRIGDSAGFFTALIFVSVFKIWNVHAYWQELKLQQGRLKHVSFRFIVNFLLCALLFYGGSLVLYLLIAVVMLTITSLYYSRLSHNKRYQWPYLVQVEQHKRNALYSLASFFIDVPHIVQRVKKRRWLDWLLHSIPYRPQSGYAYLYLRTFIRSGENLGLYVRLTIITALVITFIPNLYAVAAACIIGHAFTGVQLPAMSTKHTGSLWLQLYPLPRADKQRSVSRLVAVLLAVQTVCFTLVYQFQAPSMLLTFALLALGLLFSFMFSFIFLPRRLRK